MGPLVHLSAMRSCHSGGASSSMTTTRRSRGAAMIFATTASSIEGFQIVAFKGTAQGATFEELLNSTEALGANAVLNVCYDNAVSTDTLFHGSAVVIEQVPIPTYRRPGEGVAVTAATSRPEANGGTH